MIFLKGLFLGLLIAIPVGPIGVLCVERTLIKGRLSGFISGIGAATADAFYGAVAAFGLTLISSFLIGHQFTIRLIGGLFLLYVGIRSYLSKPRRISDKRSAGSGFINDYVSTLFLTITNPSTVISFTALFAGAGFGLNNAGLSNGAILVSGVFIGSAIWWLALSWSIGTLRKQMNNFSFEMITKVSGAIIIIFALVILSYVFLI